MSTELQVMEPECVFSQSKTLGNFAAAFVKAQKAMGAAVKGKANPFFKSKYADLAEVIEVCKEPLNENGISFLQPVVNIASRTPKWEVPPDLVVLAKELIQAKAVSKDDQEAMIDALFGTRQKPRIAVSTILLHESGEWFCCTAEFPTGKEDPQTYFATTTYLRRASLQAILGIPAEDDDGNTASGKKKKEEGNPFSKAMLSAFPPGEELTGLLVKVEPKQGSEPAKAFIQTLDGIMGHEILDSYPEYQKLVGCEVVYRYGKNGKWKPIEEMRLKEIKATVTQVEGPKEAGYATEDEIIESLANNDERMNDERLKAYAAQFTRGMVLDVQEKTSKKGPYHRLKIHVGDKPLWGSVWHSPGHFGLEAFEQLADCDVFFLYTESPNKAGGAPFINIDEIVPEDVFEQYILEKVKGAK